MASMARLAASQSEPAAESEQVQWWAKGSMDSTSAPSPRYWLALQASAKVRLACQRCLMALDLDLKVDTRLQFVAGEAQAAALDARSEHDVLDLTAPLDMLELVEDELLLQLPAVAMHPQPCRSLAKSDPADQASVNGRPPSPFEALKSWRKG